MDLVVVLTCIQIEMKLQIDTCIGTSSRVLSSD